MITEMLLVLLLVPLETLITSVENLPTCSFSAGVDQLTATLGERQIAYNKFSTENVSILDYILQGPGGANLSEATGIGNFLINIVEERRDCMAFLSPYRSIVVGQSDSETITKKVEQWADTLSSSSYTVFDSGYKYMYDRFNDVYIYVPLNGDTAGTVVYTAIRSRSLTTHLQVCPEDRSVT